MVILDLNLSILLETLYMHNLTRLYKIKIGLFGLLKTIVFMGPFQLIHSGLIRMTFKNIST